MDAMNKPGRASGVFMFATIFCAAAFALATPATFTFHEYFVYDDFIESLEGGATLHLGSWDYHDEQGHWIEVPRVINGRLDGPGVVTGGAFNGMSDDPGWVVVSISGTYQKLEMRGAEDDGTHRGKPGAWGQWVEVTDAAIPQALSDLQFLSYRLTLGQGDSVTQVDLSLSRDLRDSHPRLLVDDISELRSRCTGALSHQCEISSMFANSSHLTASLGDYSESQLARIAKVMAFDYLMHQQQVHGDRVREILLRLASYDKAHWVALRDQVQDLGLGWIGISWMLALDWSMDALKEHPGDLQTIADGTAVFVDYLLEMYKHTDFNNHFYLGRAPVLLAGIALYAEGVRDEDAQRYLDEGFDFLFNHEHPALNSVAGDMGGWHESLGYFDGEMGTPVMVDMDGLRTATGLDFFQDSSFWRTLPQWYLASTVPWDNTLVHWADQGKDRWSRALDGSESEGKGTRQYFTGLEKNLRRLGYPEAQEAQYLLDDLIGVFYDSGDYAESYYKVPHLNDVLWYEPGQGAVSLPDEPATYHFRNLGEVIFREGNSSSDPMAMFACAHFRGGHQQSDNGHFSIWYKGYLAVDSGYYDHWGSSHHMNYARRTIAHNTLTITMPGESFTGTDHNDGGQYLGCNTGYYNSPEVDPDCDACDMVLSTHSQGPYFDFVSADLTASYAAEKVQAVQREFVYLRPDLFVIHDRVTASDASYKKRFLLHGQSEFVQRADAWSVDDGQGRMFVRTLLPSNPEIVQVGGAGHEWEIDGQNYPPSDGQDFAGTHRLEISPSSQSGFDEFLHVISVTDQSHGEMVDTRLLKANGASGALAQDWLVWFGEQGTMDGLSYELDAGHALHVVVGDLHPNTAYDVRVGDSTFTESSDENGVLFFEDDRSDQHSVSLGEGTCPDEDSDGFVDASCGGTDCDDSDGAIHPGVDEDCTDGLDNDCDGLTDTDDDQCGAERDAGVDGGQDAGADASVADAGQDAGHVDAGPTDAGDSQADSGQSPSDNGQASKSITGGCACSSSSSKGQWGFWLVLSLLAFGRKKFRLAAIDKP